MLSDFYQGLQFRHHRLVSLNEPLRRILRAGFYMYLVSLCCEVSCDSICCALPWQIQEEVNLVWLIQLRADLPKSRKNTNIRNCHLSSSIR